MEKLEKVLSWNDELLLPTVFRHELQRFTHLATSQFPPHCGTAKEAETRSIIDPLLSIGLASLSVNKSHELSVDRKEEEATVCS